MRAALEFSGRRGICMLRRTFFVRSVIVVPTPGFDCHADADKQQSRENECEKLAHCETHLDEGLMGPSRLGCRIVANPRGNAGCPDRSPVDIMTSDRPPYRQLCNARNHPFIDPGGAG